MISCEVLRRHVDAWVDGEVDPDTQIEFEEHITSCGPCRVHLAFARSFKAQVKDACAPSAAPSGLAARIAQAMDAEDNARAAAHPSAPVGNYTGARAPLGLAGIRFLPMKARYAVPAAAAAVALAVIAAREGGNPVGDHTLAVRTASASDPSALFEEIVRRHSSEHPAEVVGPPTTVASWFRGKLEFPVRPVQFSSPDVHLVGARISNVQERQAAAFYYTVRGRRLTVMVFEPADPVDRFAERTNLGGQGIYYGQAHGHTVPVVEYEGLTYAFTGDLDSRTLLRLAASARLAER